MSSEHLFIHIFPFPSSFFYFQILKSPISILSYLPISQFPYFLIFSFFQSNHSKKPLANYIFTLKELSKHYSGLPKEKC